MAGKRSRIARLKCGAIINASDLSRVQKYGPWRVPTSGGWKGYAVASLPGQRHIPLHRLIMRAKLGELIDHRNGDKMDCRRRNLRRSNKRGNSRNMKSSANQKRGFYKGVFLVAGYPKPGYPDRWRAQVGFTPKDGKLRQLYLGSFLDPKDAARAYNKAARRLFGSHAALNEVRS
jgi:hypothetical protein